MNIISHALASSPILLAASEAGVLSITGWEAVYIFGAIAIAPDVSGVWSKSLSDHHGPLHTPAFWIFLAIIATVSFPTAANQILIGLLIVLVHLLMDFITARTAGIPVFYPISRKEYSLNKTQKSWGNIKPTNIFSQKYKKYVLRYFKNKKLIAFEAVVIGAGIYSLYILGL